MRRFCISGRIRGRIEARRFPQIQPMGMKTMNQTNTTHGDAVTVEMLSAMYRNVTMGSENLATVTPKIRDKELLSSVTAQLEQYADFTNQTGRLLRRRKVKPEKPSMMKKAMSRGGIMMNTMFDSTDRHIAEMIAKGTKTGADQLEDKMLQFEARGCDPEVVDLCRDIVTYEAEEAAKAETFGR